MNKLVWLLAGIALGLVGAHLLDKNPRGRAFLEAVDSRLTEFGAGVTDGYRTRDAELRDTDDR